MILRILSISIFFLTSMTLASGTMTLEGTMAGKTETTFSIESGRQIYVIKKASLSHALVKILEPKRFGDAIKIDVAMNGITEVKSSKSKK